MVDQKESPALDKSAGLKNTALIETSNKKNHSPIPVASQEKNCPAHVLTARRELLRDFAHEAAMQASDHAALLARYIELDDLPGLKYSASKFVAYAREAAKASRELIGGSP
jgi:acetyl esterase/lipase